MCLQFDMATISILPDYITKVYLFSMMPTTRNPHLWRDSPSISSASPSQFSPVPSFAPSPPLRGDSSLPCSACWYDPCYCDETPWNREHAAVQSLSTPAVKGFERMRKREGRRRECQREITHTHAHTHMHTHTNRITTACKLLLPQWQLLTITRQYLNNRTCYDEIVCIVLFSSRWWVYWYKLFNVLRTLRKWQNLDKTSSL